jgi:phosphate transport system substrate-binding protein
MCLSTLIGRGASAPGILAKVSLAVAALSAVAMMAGVAEAVDPNLPGYHPLGALTGHFKSVGSDTLGHETEAWARGFEKIYPDVKIDVEATGSATAPAALVEGRADFGPMSRPMTAAESAAFESKYGYKVSGFRVAVDALAVYVNKDNPIPCLTLPQLSGIFSSDRMAPGSSDIRTWGDLGLTGEWARQRITLYSRNTLSGTYEYFRETALYGGDYRPEIKQQPGSEAVVQAVAADKFGIGYSGIGYKTDGVRAVPLASYYGGNCYPATADATLSGKYPIARNLYIYLNKKPGQPLDTLRAEFVKYILSRNGQEQTERGGFFPITNEVRESDLSKLGIAPGS